MAEKRTLLIPSLLDAHYPLLRWAFASPQWEPVLLGGDWRELEHLGQRHVHNDLCVPFVLITGQVLSALRSGNYDPERTAVLVAQAGDACRGSCLIRLLRPVLDREGFSRVRLLSLNVRGIERGAALPVGPLMALRARPPCSGGTPCPPWPPKSAPGRPFRDRRRPCGRSGWSCWVRTCAGGGTSRAPASSAGAAGWPRTSGPCR